jgi:glutamine amidotransferase
MRRVALVDYGSGNLPSAEKALRKAAATLGDIQVTATADPDQIAKADAVVLPGVGAFAACMSALRSRPGLIDAMTEAVHGRGVPFLGICVGMQLLAEQGHEFGLAKGLGWIGGEVRQLAPTDRTRKIPHMGWNSLDCPLRGQLMAGFDAGVHMYFTHSLALYPNDPACVAATTDHGGGFVSAVTQGNVAGVQFHPEKSQDAGGRLLANFLEWRP